MTSRPRLSFTAKQRPLSAIFLGSISSPNNIPDLPEPPSPGAASNDSGLPSPPATNSTGSGSASDNNSNNAGSLRQRPPSFSYPETKMYDGNYDSNRNEDDDEENRRDDEGEDNTARLDRRRSTKSSSENVMALQRVKNLAQRNRQALDKLSSYSRLNTPSPTSGPRFSRSPNPPSSGASSSTASSRLSAHSHSHSEPRPYDLEQPLSGSETERESQHLSYSSDDMSSTPPSTASTSAARPPSSFNGQSTRLRRISAPASPVKALSRTSNDRDRASPGPSRTPRKRVSMAMSAPDEDDYDQDVSRAALAAVASSRRSPTTGTGRRSRQPLPREFRERDRRSSDGRSAGEPSTPHRDRSGYTAARGTSPSPKSGSSGQVFGAPNSPRALRTTRSSTVRDLTRRHQTRWLSEDLSSSGMGDQDGEEDRHMQGETNGLGRRQSQRGGSTELIGVGRSLVGEGLRAAGIVRKDAGEDVFGGGQIPQGSQRRIRSNPTNSLAEWEEGGGFVGRVSEGVGPPRDPHTPAQPENARMNRNSYQGLGSRPNTSIGDYHHDEEARMLRRQKSVYINSDREPAPTVRVATLQQQPPERATASPFNNPNARRTPFLPPATPSSNHQPTNSEHGRLMLESLSMFESHLARLPPMGTTTTSELFRHAQTIVQAADRLNTQLRTGTSRALEEQIDAEVGYDDDRVPADMVDVWRRVGNDYRENLKVSDELVRTMTGFLLGIGKVLKETMALSDNGQQQHLRSVSLDDEVARRPSPDVNLDSGRRSAVSRRSWEPSPRDPVGEQASRRLSSRAEGAFNVRPPSALNSRDRDSSQDGDYESPQTGMNGLTRSGTLPASASMRRLLTPREQREQQMNTNGAGAHITPSNSQELPQGYDPSPTPLSRQNQPSNARPVASLSIPPPLPTLPSESILRRSNTVDQNGRRKVSTASIVTVRANNPTFPAISTTSATTALTPHTVSNSPEVSYSPLSRNDLSESLRTTSVTFSRPSTISVSALNGLQQQHYLDDRRRIPSASSSEEYQSQSRTPANTARTPYSASDSERDNRRRTIGAKTARMSLDGALLSDREGENGSQARTVMLPSAARRERRRTVTEVFS